MKIVCQTIKSQNVFKGKCISFARFITRSRPTNKIHVSKFFNQNFSWYDMILQPKQSLENETDASSQNYVSSEVVNLEQSLIQLFPCAFGWVVLLRIRF